MDSIYIYTDGACSGNQNDTNLGGWGAILVYKGHKKELYGGEKNTTNNRMEMTAFLQALKSLKKGDLSINIFSDSGYLIDCFTKKWYVNWQKNGWKNASKKPVENKDLWVELLDEVKKHKKINFYRVKGHLNINSAAQMNKWFPKFKSWNGPNFTMEEFVHVTKMNIRADELANMGVDEIR
ncbi:RNase H family protein [Anaeromicrobium sediminis]|uniref:ribonuclease H n=1 Tax=Anaeromicrobium sediminis TaxID=1478221 RepID=A0A267MMC4_9FIRM|nr:RNase H family protein [Anaeromicrobium sediminis]PAB59953.1 hypothetical protein CCE28_08340 [Anaeromicrobium sediminis]